jgi:DNA-binding transcriptional regulator YdaS (Cro superfamily)
MEQALQKAKEIAGGAAGLARAISQATGKEISSQAVSQWDRVPASRVLIVERVTGISRYELRPDVCGPAPAEAANG